MRAGLLTEGIDIQRPIIERSDYGENTQTWATAISTRAQVKWNSGSRANENNEIVWGNYTDFTVRIYHNVDEQMRLIYRGHKYRIIAINLNRHEQSLTIRTELINE